MQHCYALEDLLSRSDQPKRLLVALNFGSLLPLALALDFRFRLPLLGLFLILLRLPADWLPNDLSF